MPLPLAHGLIGASIVAASRPRETFREKWKFLLLGAILGISPDLDLLIAWGFGLGNSWHGSFSHSIVFAIAAGLLVSSLTGDLKIKGAAVYVLAVLSHAVLDAATSKVWGAIKLFWPVSDRRFNFGLFDYFEFIPNPETNPIADDLKRALEISLYELLIFAPVLLLVLLISRRVMQARRSREDDSPITAETRD
ncbi:MAG: metal-dependent hydrolase [Blastocatellia bacterium]|nr:metal-dependent hydrolase [Blastocatellia bacterium]